MLGRTLKHGGYSRWLFPLAALIWFCTAFFAINWVSQSKFTEFDPQLRLSSQMMSLTMEDDLLSVLLDSPELASLENVQEAKVGAPEGIIFHVSQGDCFCETLSESHQNTLNQWAANQGLHYQNLDLNKVPGLSRFVPSTPAVIVLNKENNLVYLGPYSSGMGCFQDSGMVDARIKPYFQSALIESDSLGTASIKNATIQSEAKGCYCATKSRAT